VVPVVGRLGFAAGPRTLVVEVDVVVDGVVVVVFDGGGDVNEMSTAKSPFRSLSPSPSTSTSTSTTSTSTPTSTLVDFGDTP
jgi:hypothetical protein